MSRMQIQVGCRSLMWGIIAAVLGGAVALAALESATGERLVDILAVCRRKHSGTVRYAFDCVLHFMIPL